MKYLEISNNIYMVVINITNYKCVIWNCFLKSGHILDVTFVHINTVVAKLL